MKKLFNILLLVVATASCAGPVLDLRNKFLNIVYKYYSHEYTNLLSMQGIEAEMSVASNEILLLIDSSHSIYPLSYWVYHQPIVVGKFEGIYNDGKPMADWDEKEIISNAMKISTNSDVWYISFQFPENYLAMTNSNWIISFKIANYLDTPSGKMCLVNSTNPGSILGYFIPETNQIHMKIKNSNGVLIIESIEQGGKTNQKGLYISNSKRAFGILINSSFCDWDVQSEGLPEVPSGKTIKIIWKNVPTGSAKPVNGNIWTTYPNDAVLTGDGTWMHTSNDIWNPEVGISVAFSMISAKGVVMIKLNSIIAPGFQLKLANNSGFGNGEEKVQQRV
ncbi:MAG: hypothetical protein A2Y33_00740 [Spirochaetes bacterium GWF1_51_8]|nr:MAG: hypothetical protein A2Y33_00740 [Spirochaetes bacterium GWF1_51_8]